VLVIPQHFRQNPRRATHQLPDLVKIILMTTGAFRSTWLSLIPIFLFGRSTKRLGTTSSLALRLFFHGWQRILALTAAVLPAALKILLLFPEWLMGVAAW